MAEAGALYGGDEGDFDNMTSSVSSISNIDMVGYANDGVSAAIAKGLAGTEVEGGFDAIAESDKGDFPSIGFSQWEEDRADRLLSWINGGSEYIGRSWSSLTNDDKKQLKALLSSPQGIEAQTKMLSEDISEKYLPELSAITGFTNKECIAYAGMWCPTSHYVVSDFIEECKAKGVNVNDLAELSAAFKTKYADFAGYPDLTNAEGVDEDKKEQFANIRISYSNRADTTYEFISKFGL